MMNRQAVMKIIDMPSLSPLPIKTESHTPKEMFRITYKGILWEVNKNWFYILSNGIKIVIPAGFTTDLASVPRLAWPIISPFGVLLIPGLIHDFAYRYNYLWAVDENGMLFKYDVGIGKEFWDELFKTVGNEVNKIPYINEIAYLSLKWFGGKAWKENRERNESDIIVNLGNLNEI